MTDVTDAVPLDGPPVLAGTPATTSSPPLPISITPASPADVPSLTVLEMLAFVNDPTSLHLNPIRPVLVSSGAAPEKWPEYQNMLRRRHKSFVTGQMVFKATFPRSSVPSGENIVGMALMTPPKRLLLPVSLKGRLWGTVLYPTYDRIRMFMPDDMKADGSDEVFAGLFRDLMRKTRKEVMQDREHFVLNLLFTSTPYARSGVGSALLKHCVAIADAAHLPIILESTLIARTLYERHGFKTVKVSRLEYLGDVLEWPVMVREPVGGYVSGGEAGEGVVDMDDVET